MTYAMLFWLQPWHIRDETYSTALAELVNSQFNHAFATNWGDGATSSEFSRRRSRREHRTCKSLFGQRACPKYLQKNVQNILGDQRFNDLKYQHSLAYRLL